MHSNLTIESVFSSANLKHVWAKCVWSAMREQGCNDLIEYYDYNVDILDHAKRLSPQIVSGNFRPSRSLVVHQNKSDKLVRRLQIPTPDDALVFQVITESILPLVTEKAPTKKAYFSRSHATPRGIHTMDAIGLYPWFKLWPKYQINILDFTRAHRYLVITDIQNFFESVPHSAIDRALSLAGVAEWLRDMILFMLEHTVERELYAPLARRGLPVLNLDAPRLLAHLLLFSMDEQLNHRTQGAFARWVDDINFGVDTKLLAHTVIRELEKLLARVELRLNGRKTQILSRQEAETYLFVHENSKLTANESVLKSPSITVQHVDGLIEDFLYFDAKSLRDGHWDQVYRRYVGQLVRTASVHISAESLVEPRERLQKRLVENFEEYHDFRMREVILRYWNTQPMTIAWIEYLLLRFRDTAKTDDIIAFKIASLIASANLGKGLQAVVIGNLHTVSIRPGGMVGVALLLAKYGDAGKIEAFINATANAWATNDFLARQMICLWSILTPHSEISERLKAKLSAIVQRGPNDLIHYFEELRRTKVLPKGLESYVSPANMKKPYTIAKAIIASNLLRSSRIPVSTRQRLEGVFKTVSDDRLSGLALNQIHT